MWNDLLNNPDRNHQHTKNDVNDTETNSLWPLSLLSTVCNPEQVSAHWSFLAMQRFIVKRWNVVAVVDDPPDVPSRQVRKLRADSAIQQVKRVKRLGLAWPRPRASAVDRTHRQPFGEQQLRDRLNAVERRTRHCRR